MRLQSCCTLVPMNAITKGWFSECSEGLTGLCSSLKIEKVLHKEQSPYQEVTIVQTTHCGKALILDNLLQLTEFDEFPYQEMISFLPLCVHPNPSKVLIVGGGDGGVVRECHKHPLVEEIVLVEIDSKVVEVTKRHLPFLAKGFESSKLTLNICDGFKYMEEHKNEFDVIITDSSDPVGPAVTLFTESYFGLVKEALKSGGVICSQNGMMWLNLKKVKETIDNCKKHFPVVRYAVTSIPTFPSGQIGFIVAALDDVDVTVPKYKLGEMELRYYNEEIHAAAFALPNFVKNVLYS